MSFDEFRALWEKGNSKAFIITEEYKQLRFQYKRLGIKTKASDVKYEALKNIETYMLKYYKGCLK